MFIHLTQLDDGPIWINSNKILSFEQMEFGIQPESGPTIYFTQIETAERYYSVEETPEQILAQLEPKDK